MVDSRKEQPVANEHFKARGFTVPEEILALVTSGEIKDLSWHNDAAPCYGLVVRDAVTVGLFVDHPKPRLRSERFLTDQRFLVCVFSIDRRILPTVEEGDVLSTNDASVAVKSLRETLVDIKAKLDARTPKTCEACNVPLTDDLQCPKCGVSHSGDACPTCGRFGLHKNDCNEPPHGNGFEGGPAYVPPRVSEARLKELIATFERAYQYYNGWGFSYEHPGIFTYYQLGGDLRVCFTPDWTEPGQVDVQVQADSGAALADQGGDHEFKDDHSAPALFRIVKPYLDRLAGKTSKDFER